MTSTHTHTHTVGYAPFLSMAVRESFLTVGEQLAAAPGPGHYSHHTAFRPTKGGGILHNKVVRVYSDCIQTVKCVAPCVSLHTNTIR